MPSLSPLSSTSPLYDILIYTPVLLILTQAILSILGALRPKNFPPGPRGLPALGNLLELDRKFPFRTFTSWATKIGRDVPLGWKSAANNVVVLNSARLVHELFDKRGAIFSDRPYMYINAEWIVKYDLKVAVFQNNDAWLNRWRRDVALMLTSAAIKRLTPVYDAEAARLLIKVLESGPATGHELLDVLTMGMLSVPCLELCGTRPDDLGVFGDFRQVMEDWFSLVTPGATDVFPPLRYLPGFLAPWKYKAQRVRNSLLYQDAQQKVRKEVFDLLGGAPPQAANLPDLPFLEACYNEILRWRPVAPMGIPHAPSRDDTVDGHRIPKGSSVIPNVWNIHHDEADYENPDEFIPERFLQHPWGMRMDDEHDPARLEKQGRRTNYTFGAGRRVCLGMESAKKSFLVGMAKFLWAFEVHPRDAERGVDLSLDTGFISDLTLKVKNLDIAVKLRDGLSREDVYKHYEDVYPDEARLMGWETVEPRHI
ncbi:cytochrome P450 [Coniochaeta sp. 2T2.1]|nr:cytochrome P450 [Coniochaeta sp. 2T2.1]